MAVVAIAAVLGAVMGKLWQWGLQKTHQRPDPWQMAAAYADEKETEVGGVVPRRTMAVAAAALFGATASVPMSRAFPPTDAEDPIPAGKYVRLPSGVVYADAEAGSGRAVEAGDRISLQWVLRRSNGYFVDSSNVSGGEPFQFVVGDPKGAIAGLDEAVRGMRAGGVRRVLIPPPLAYIDGVEDGRPGPLPVGFGPRQQVRRIMEVRRDVPGEYIFLEVELTRIYPS